MNLPNKLSILRVLLIPVMVLLMYIPGIVPILLSTAVFGVAAFTDFMDGYIARRDNIVTDFGKFIDPVADKLLNLSAMIMLTMCGQMPHYVVLVVLARELAVDGLRMVAVGQGRVIAAGKLGKIKTVSQMVLIIVLMLAGRLVSAIPALNILQLPVQIVGWLGCAWVAFITIWSGVDYFIRNKDCISNVK